MLRPTCLVLMAASLVAAGAAGAAAAVKAVGDVPDCWILTVTWEPFPVPRVYLDKSCVPCIVETARLCLTRDAITKVEDLLRGAAVA